MLEVEVKGWVRTPEQVRAVEEYVDTWSFVGEDNQEDIYFSHPCRDFASTDEALRLRRCSKGTFLTYKGPKLDSISKTREELEIEVPAEIVQILRRVGFKEAGRVCKTRRSFRKNDLLLFIDDVQGLGRFVELESTTGGLPRARDLLEILKSLRLRPERRSYLELLLSSDG